MKNKKENLKHISRLYAAKLGMEIPILDKQKESYFKFFPLRKDMEMKQNNEISSEEEIRVGIWKKTGDYFIRDVKYNHEFIQWANTDRFSEKKKKKRIIFLGESVARGYLLCPEVTPAKILQKILKSNDDSLENNFEVIDLSRTSISLNELETLIKECIVLEPDLIVIFAGNNWKKSIYPLDKEESEEIVKKSKEEKRFEKIYSLYQNMYTKKINQFFNNIRIIVKEIRTIFILPEYNLKDWGISEDDSIPTWCQQEDKEWYELVEELELAKKTKRLFKIKEISQKLISLNPTCSLGFVEYANCIYKEGNVNEARKYFEKALNCGIFQPYSPPSCPEIIREEIKKNSVLYGIEVIDLRIIFNEYLNGDIPGNELFLDYCHLNFEGLRIAMFSLAEKILNRISYKVELDFKLLDEVVSRGYFLSAIHCAHTEGKSEEYLLTLCDKAIESSQHIILYMLQYLEMVNQKLRFVFCKQNQFFCRSQLLKTYPLLYQPDRQETMDIELVRAIVTALKKKEIDVEEKITQLRIEQFSAQDEAIDLLESYYSENTYTYGHKRRGAYFKRSDRSFVSVIKRNTSFWIIANAEETLVLEFSVRVPQINYKTERLLLIYLNEKLIKQVRVGGNWQSERIAISNSLLRSDSVNKLELKWPFWEDEYLKMCALNELRYEGYDLLVRNSKLEYGDIFRLDISRKIE